MMRMLFAQVRLCLAQKDIWGGRRHDRSRNVSLYRRVRDHSEL
jgi:hypothetical protein